MPDDVQTKPASTTQSTGDIVSVTQVHSTHQHSSSTPNPLRKATSDNHPGNAACIIKGRGSPTSKSADTAVGMTFNAPDTAKISQTVKPAFLELPSSIGDHYRPTSLPTARQGIEKTNLGRRPASEQRDGFDMPATDFVMSAITKNISELASDVDDMSWTTSLSHNSSPAPEGRAENTDTVTDPPRFSSTTPMSTGASRLSRADHSGDTSEYQLHRLLPKVTLLSPYTRNSVDCAHISSADPACTPADVASADISDVKLSSVCPEPHDSPLSAKEHRPRDGTNQEAILPRVRVKQVIMKYSPNPAVNVQRISPKTTCKTASPATATGNNVQETSTDCAVTKYSQNVANCVQPTNTSKIASNIITGDTDGIKLDATDRQATSKNHKTLSSDSRSEDGDVTGKWCDSGNMSRWKTTSKLFQADNDRRLVKSEGQTPVSTEERCRVSQTSSLDQLRLRFQHQRKTAGRFRAELDRLKKKVIDAQHELDKERNGRRKLEEWTDYLENQLETYTFSRSVVEKQYRKLLDTTKEVDQFTKFVIDKYAELHHHLQLNPDNDDDDVVKPVERQSSRELQDSSATRELTSTGCQRRQHDMHSSCSVSSPSAQRLSSTAVSIGDVGLANVGESQRMSVEKSNSRQEEVTDQSNNLTGSDVARSNDSRNIDKQRFRLMARVSKDRSGCDTAAAGTEGNVENIQVLPHHQKHATQKDRPATNKADLDVEYRQVAKAQSSGQMIQSVWNNVGEDVGTSRSASKKKRTRNKNVNASTQTTPSDDDVQKLGDASAKSQSDRRVDEDAENHDVDSEKLADMIRLLAAPILASEVKTALAESRHPDGEVSSLDVVDERSSPSRDNNHFRHHHHHHHHHHPRHYQPEKYRSRWQQTADIMARRPVVTITSYDKSRATDSPERCPHCTRRRRARFSMQDAGETPSSTEDVQTTLDQMLAEMCRYCDQDCGPGETVSQLKAKLKRAILAKYSHK